MLGRARRYRWVGAVVIGAVVGTPLTATASQARSARTLSAVPAGVVYGGVTPQGFPVVIEVAKDRRQIVRATIGVHLTCTSGMQASFADGYTHVPLSKKGRFNTSFGPNRTTHADGTFDEVQGSMTGVTNAKRTKMSGTWQLTVIEHDAAGAVTDTCDSGKVAWKAKQ